MDMSCDILHRLLIQKQSEQPIEFAEVINFVNCEQIDPEIYDLINYLSQTDVQYITYSHA